jgi:hypothetical protein
VVIGNKWDILGQVYLELGFKKHIFYTTGVWYLSSSYVRQYHGFMFWKLYRLRTDLVCVLVCARAHVCVRMCVRVCMCMCMCLRVLFFILCFSNIIFSLFYFYWKSIGLMVSWYLWLMEVFVGFHILLMFRWSYFHAWNLWLIVFI